MDDGAGPPESPEQGWPARVEVGRYLRRDQAEDRALTILALGLPYWIVPHDGLYLLVVESAHAEAVSLELQKYEEERREERRQLGLEMRKETLFPTRRRFPTFSLYLYAWAMAAFFLLQVEGPPGWLDLGAADSQAILHGQWWRTLTALTLHADLGHLLANIAVGLLFGAALLPCLGSGWTWFGMVASGAAGNAINAWGFRGTPHSSIGASTAVFGALGILVGWQVFTILHTSASEGRPRWRELFIPVAAGLALLAYLGTGGADATTGQPGGGPQSEHVDFMAHLSGMLAGGALGLLLAWRRLPQRTSPALQKLLALAAILLPCLAWLLAWAIRDA